MRRRYFEIVLEGGQNTVVLRDEERGSWFTHGCLVDLDLVDVVRDGLGVFALVHLPDVLVEAHARCVDVEQANGRGAQFLNECTTPGAA